jgi:hypothetical protein
MKFVIEKKRAILLFQLLGGGGIFSDVAIISSHGKIMSCQYSPIYRVTRYAEFDESYFHALSYDTSGYQSFRIKNEDYQTKFKLMPVLRIPKTKILTFQFPDPTKEKLGNNFLCISYPDVNINLFVKPLGEWDNIEKFFKIETGRAILKDNTVLDTVIKIRKNILIQALKGNKKQFAQFIISVTKAKIEFESFVKKRKKLIPGLSIDNLPCVIQKCNTPIQLKFYNLQWLEVLKTLETNPTIYLGQNKPALLVNNFRDHRIAFFIPNIEEENINGEKNHKNKNRRHKDTRRIL